MVSAWQQPPRGSPFFFLFLFLILVAWLPSSSSYFFPFSLHVAYTCAERVSVISQYHIPPLTSRHSRQPNRRASSEACIDDNDNRQECTVFFARAISLYPRWEPPSMLASPCNFATTCSNPEDTSVSSHDIMAEFSKEVLRGLEEPSLFSSSSSSCV